MGIGNVNSSSKGRMSKGGNGAIGTGAKSGGKAKYRSSWGKINVRSAELTETGGK